MSPPPPPEPAPVPAGGDLVASYNALAGDVQSLSSRLERAETRLEDVLNVLDDLESKLLDAARAGAESTAQPFAAAASSDTTPAGEKDAEEEAEDEAAAERLDMRQLVTWVRANVGEVLERRIPQTGGVPYWCRQWWKHPEAVVRFEAWQESWADAMATGGSAKVLSLGHLDAMLAVLCGANGPFSGCTGGIHRDKSQVQFLDHEEPPEEYFLELERLQNPTAPADPVGQNTRGS